MGLCVSLLRPFARGQQVGGFNLEITSLQCRRRKVPWGLTLPECLLCLPARPAFHLPVEPWKLQPKGNSRRHCRSLTRGPLH